MAKRVPSRPLSAVVLRDVTKDDLPILFGHQADPGANRMAAFPARDRDSFLAHWTKILADASVTVKTVLWGGAVAGNVVSFERFGKREVGYWIGRSYWGSGVATQALAELLRQVTARPLHARVAKHNGASIRVLEKCGFTIAEDDNGSTSSPAADVEEILLKLEA